MLPWLVQLLPMNRLLIDCNNVDCRLCLSPKTDVKNYRREMITKANLRHNFLMFWFILCSGISNELITNRLQQYVVVDCVFHFHQSRFENYQWRHLYKNKQYNKHLLSLHGNFLLPFLVNIKKNHQYIKKIPSLQRG